MKLYEDEVKEGEEGFGMGGRNSWLRGIIGSSDLLAVRVSGCQSVRVSGCHDAWVSELTCALVSGCFSFPWHLLLLSS